MMNEYKASPQPRFTDFSFSVDGTLIDRKGNIRDGVLLLINLIKQNYPDAHINIISSLPYENAKNAVDQINSRLAWHGMGPIAPNYSCLSGAVFVESNGRAYTATSLPADFIKGAIEIAKYHDPMATVYLNVCDDIDLTAIDKDLYGDAQGQRALSVQHKSEFHSESWIKRNLYDRVVEYLKTKVQPDFPTEAVSKQQFEEDLEQNKVRTIQMSSISKTFSKEIFGDLKKYAAEYNQANGTNIKITPGSAAIEISSNGKEWGYAQLIGTPNEKHMYIGDGNNDCKILEAVKNAGGCAIGFRKMPAAKSGNYAATEFDQVIKIIKHEHAGGHPNEYADTKTAREEIENQSDSKFLGVISAIHTPLATPVAKVKSLFNENPMDK
ncbi:MAG: HAD family hydrolase [Christensenellaceae bacterium]|nr:HAD family hydrolase [Christensenellaceae bacterium]